MTATDRLRAMLDERGVEWDDLDGEPVWFGHDGRVHYARQEFTFNGETDEVTVYHLTPEQAIAATLGHSLNNPSMSETLSERETCTIEREERGCNFAYRLYTLSCGHTVWTMDDAPNFCPSCGRKVEG